MKTGKAGTEWVKGRKCTGCRYYVSEARKKSDYIGRCTKFGIGVIDCLCGCRPKKDGGTVLINFEEDVLDKIRNGYSEPEEPAEKEEIMQKQSMTEVEMKTFSYEILPVIRRIREIMEKNGTGSGIRIYMSEKYVSVEEIEHLRRTAGD